MSGEIEQDPVVRQLREEITANDCAIVAAVNRRLELVGELWRHKAEHGYATTDPRREESLLAELAGANSGPLSTEGLRALLLSLLRLTRGEVGDARGRSG